MKLRPEQVAEHLRETLLPVYLVTGEEPLLVQECGDQIRRAARAAGCAERTLHDAAAGSFRWADLVAGAASLSLFSERRLTELRIPGGKPGKEGSAAIIEYLQQAGGDDVLLVVSGKIDKQSTRSKWFTALDQAGAIVQIWPVGARELPAWLRRRSRSAGLEIDDEALQLLCERVEGNLLAAAQEVEKLALLAPGGPVTVDTVIDAVCRSARYSPFALADAALRGDLQSGLRVLHGLRDEGAEPAVVLWALVRDIRTLHQLHGDRASGDNIQRAMTARRVWQSRAPLMSAALSRQDGPGLQRLLERATAVDGSIKGFAPGRPWDRLESLLSAFC